MKYVICILVSLFLISFFVSGAVSEEPGLTMTDGMGLGMPFGGDSSEPDLDLCPMGANVVGMFLAAWKKGDIRAMYDLLDEDSKRDYPFEQARFDFRMLEFRPYNISSIRKVGENFEFLLSSGDWKDGDKATRKMIISGRTFKIIMPTKGSPFKRSAEDYF
ncbi:MAG: hypothetical protein WBB86_04770 [Candidatus Omnitrophota bacterium]